jgi:hypothetical protein
MFTHTNAKGTVYHLNSKTITRSTGNSTTLYYFSKDERPEATDLPTGYEVGENSRTGMPYVKRSK